MGGGAEPQWRGPRTPHTCPALIPRDAVGMQSSDRPTATCIATEQPLQGPRHPLSWTVPCSEEGELLPLTFEAAHEEVEPAEEDSQGHRGEQHLQLHAPGAKHGVSVGHRRRGSGGQRQPGWPQHPRACEGQGEQRVGSPAAPKVPPYLPAAHSPSLVVRDGFHLSSNSLSWLAPSCIVLGHLDHLRLPHHLITATEPKGGPQTLRVL